LLATKAKTSLKIGGSVGIIILLLGIAALFGLNQMSKVSQEIIEISEEYVPLNKILSDIRLHQSNQAQSFDKILRIYDSESNIELQKSKEEFWMNSGLIDSDISRGKIIVQSGIQISSSENDSSKYLNLFQKFIELERIHNNYENIVGDIFLNLGLNEFKNVEYSIEQSKQLEIEFQNEVNLGLKNLAILTDESTSRIETNERDSLIGQIIIVTVVGAIAAFLGFFINQINKDLKKEVDSKTIDLKKANEKLKKLDEMKDEFIGIASHELKSPLQPILGFAELAKSGDIDQKEAWDGVTELANKLQDLANAVLDVSKIESNRLKLQIEKIPINDSIMETINELKIKLKIGVKIHESLDENADIEVDKIRFGQVIRNLLDNAIKFTPIGTIIVNTKVIQDENKVIVTISDSGLGIPKEILPNIFEKFVTKGKSNQSGTGLGLFLCKGIIEAHGGKITARNNQEKGATFEFSLPILQNNKFQKIPKIFTN
jgi:signal transduction histidine kinase